MQGLLSSLYQIVRYGQNTNSYKFALWRALVRLAAQTDQHSPKISTQLLAPIFLELYWPLEVTYHLRQGTDPDKDPIVMVAIRKLMKDGLIFHGMNLTDFKKRQPSAYANLVAATERKAFDYVIACFHTVRGVEAAPMFFSHRATQGRSGGEIVLTKDAREFLISNGPMIDYVAVAGWVNFTEGFSSSPKLVTKLSGEKHKRGSLAVWRKSLAEIQAEKCFYCDTTAIDKPEVDHVLPWSYVLEDRTWNLVLSCGRCNGTKSDRLPPMHQIEKLVARNIALVSDQIAVSDSKFLRHFDEWHSRDLSAHLRSMYDQAVAEQYPVWTRN
jgi:hypothetical protein